VIIRNFRKQIWLDIDLNKIIGFFLFQILITHEHFDHYDKPALNIITVPSSHYITNGVVGASVKGAEIIKNGQTTTWNGIEILAVPAYNVVNTKFHPKGRDNGYVLSFGGFRVYIAGDTGIFIGLFFFFKMFL
jgi:L-ascorbate metabolism protein UlaG (beta-lactamase superfamily)